MNKTMSTLLITGIFLYGLINISGILLCCDSRPHEITLNPNMTHLMLKGHNRYYCNNKGGNCDDIYEIKYTPLLFSIQIPVVLTKTLSGNYVAHVIGPDVLNQNGSPIQQSEISKRLDQDDYKETQSILQSKSVVINHFRDTTANLYNLYKPDHFFIRLPNTDSQVMLRVNQIKFEQKSYIYAWYALVLCCGISVLVFLSSYINSSYSMSVR